MEDGLDYYYTSPAKEKEQKPNDKLMVIVSLTIMFGIFILSAIGSLQTYFFRNGVETVVGLIGFLFFGGAVWSFFKTATTNAGRVNGYTPVASVDELEAAKKRVEDGVLKNKKTCDMMCRVRWCPKCESFRPSRSYHCNKCKMCVERRDHHCPWVKNCIGKNNYKYFIQFLLYTDLALVVSVTVNIFVLVDSTKNKTQDVSLYAFTTITPSATGLAFSVLLLLSITLLLINHLYNIGANVTLMEIIEKERLLSLNTKMESLVNERVPSYDRGIANNFKEVFGSTFREWVLPVKPKSNVLEV
ncbi:zinc finger protein DHHC domain containing protein, putative [Entamoeba invadens IP1]|uniref:Palmitoyltransferase n=1 Tax=Entamoeba invadens IP1 TaxID=370355 RepID=A0A0A1UE97_ENTIV|nr:zinc finger protein DHHC domain containing protein, putative [Entamoeba invadens IP1]ELP92106.1 zinc finger protein DHHC domain containing protein, putative [Entamoeba invadens IP1]|eukprot:XP_004258877.1 zinc finger protein DHHC domain containing protein, putative [Entamoeba invadens IP1]